MKSKSILQNAQHIIDSNQTRDEKLQCICELLDKEVDLFDWTGFYLTSEEDEQMLLLGPYVGEKTDHTKIPFGKGICGQVAETLDTFVVQDVNQAENYLACSIHVQSEIVVPILKGDQLVGELDIDSHTEDAIKPELRVLCENICKKISMLF